jgi:hypothetical protein
MSLWNFFLFSGLKKEYNKSVYSLVKYNNILKAMNSRTSGMITYIGL